MCAGIRCDGLAAEVAADDAAWRLYLQLIICRLPAELRAVLYRCSAVEVRSPAAAGAGYSTALSWLVNVTRQTSSDRLAAAARHRHAPTYLPLRQIKCSCAVKICHNHHVVKMVSLSYTVKKQPRFNHGTTTIVSFIVVFYSKTRSESSKIVIIVRLLLFRGSIMVSESIIKYHITRDITNRISHAENSKVDHALHWVLTVTRRSKIILLLFSSMTRSIGLIRQWRYNVSLITRPINLKLIIHLWIGSRHSLYTLQLSYAQIWVARWRGGPSGKICSYSCIV